MKRLLQAVLLFLLLNSSSAIASHSFGGLDMCTLYPEIMPPGLSPEQLPDKHGQAAALMQTYCTQCHEMPGPGRHTAEEWPMVLDHMFKLMDVADRFGGLLGNVKTPSSEERDLLRDYLALYALKPMQQAPQGIGASAFEQHCSACHVLPDPARYNQAEWPGLVKRMQRNMQVMKYPPPSADSMMQIQLYLQKNNDFIQTSRSPAGDDLIPDKSSNTNNAYEASFNTGSWLSLGLFSVLSIIGFVRWFKTPSAGIKQIKS